jgi:hypothetical protein
MGTLGSLERARAEALKTTGASFFLWDRGASQNIGRDCGW